MVKMRGLLEASPKERLDMSGPISEFSNGQNANMDMDVWWLHGWWKVMI